MFNATAQSGALFSNPQNQNIFGQASNQQPSLFGSSNTAINGTTFKYSPLMGNDNIQKNNTTVNVQTKLNCISAMKEYEAKSLEELRYEDYSANRIVPQKSATSGMFGTNQTGSGLFNNQTSMFQSNSFNTNQQTLLGNTSNNLFGSNNQTNTFGQKTLFGGATAPTSSAFGTFNIQPKQNTLFGMNTSTANKPFFGSSQPTQSTSVFGTSQQSTTSLFGSQPSSQSSSLFGGLNAQQSPQTGLFNSNTSTSSFGFQSQPQTGLFGNTSVAKPFPFSNSTPQSSAPIFGNTATSGGLFSQTNQTFGSTTKSLLFSNPSTFSAPTNSQASTIFSQQPSGFGQTNPFQTNQAKPNAQFGTTNTFNNAPKTGLFGTNTNTSTGFGNQNTGSIFGNFGSSNQTLGNTITTNSIAPINNTYQIGMTNPAEAAYQQQLIQQKILNLATNRPYGVNKLFMGQNLLGNEAKAGNSENNVNNMNLSSLVIKRNENDNSGAYNRRRILNQKTKVIPHQLYKVFSGFDEDEELSTKSNSIDNFFFTKREDWKYLPANAFEKSRKSLNISLANSAEISHQKDNRTSPFTQVAHISKAANENYCSTPISINSLRKPNSNLVTSPIHVTGRSSPDKSFEAIISDSIIQNNSNEKPSAKSEDFKKEVIDKVLIESKIEQNEVNESESDLDDESVNADVQKNCQIKLTKPGYYTNPDRDMLDQLTSINQYGKLECWVDNLIIGRKKYGYIKFLGQTDIYGLNLDELVFIQQKEVIVYPDDDVKPIEGDGLNKPAEVVLMEVWPVDKATGAVIDSPHRLSEMKFEDRLQRSTLRMGATFISYKPENGIWIFRVEHFSKYTFVDDSDDDQANTASDNTQSTETNQFKKETKLKSATKPLSNTQSTQVITAEADSLSNVVDYDHSMNTSIHHSSVFNKLLDASGAKDVMKMKQSCIFGDDDMQVDNATTFHGFSAYKNTLPMVKGNASNKYGIRDYEQPKSKKFETVEMGEQILNSSQNNSLMQMVSLNTGRDEKDQCPIKPLEPTNVASTVPVPHCQSLDHRSTMPTHLRELRMTKLPYLFLKFISYFDSVTPNMYKRCASNVSMTQGNRFRVGMHTSCDSSLPGLRFFRINRLEHHVTSFNGGWQNQMPPNALVLVNLSQNISNYQKQLMEMALSTAQCSIDPDTKCPKWAPMDGLNVLNQYMKSLSVSTSAELTREHIVLERIIRLCNALWNTLDQHQESMASLPDFMRDLRRKQLIANWIKSECRPKLAKQVEALLQVKSIDIDQCNDVILNAICSGEIELACKLAVATKQHRLSLLIAQAGSDLQGRELLRDQINMWIQSKADQHIPTNVLQIYLVLSGQTNATLSNGSIVTSLKHMTWVQALGTSLWFSQSYLGSIRSAIELYDDAFKTELDIPFPNPIDVEGTFPADESRNDEYRYNDCCYHLIKLYCDPLHDLEVLLNPPTVSRSRAHAVSMDWSVSWHLANLLASIGLVKEANYNTVPGKISAEWAVQLEHGGHWTMAAFVLLHVVDATRRRALVTALLDRHVTVSEVLTEDERFVVDRLKVPLEWVHEAKARQCKSLGPDQCVLEALHWFLAGKHEASHRIYIEHVLPQLLINSRIDEMDRVLHQFTDKGIDRTLQDWSIGGALYLLYVRISRNLDTLRATSALATMSVLIGPADGIQKELELDLVEETDNHISVLRNDALALLHNVRDNDCYHVSTDTQRVCKEQIVAMCDRVMQACSS